MDWKKIAALALGVAGTVAAAAAANKKEENKEPQKIKCMYCNGLGKLPGAPGRSVLLSGITCRACGGRGWVYQQQVSQMPQQPMMPQQPIVPPMGMPMMGMPMTGSSSSSSGPRVISCHSCAGSGRCTACAGRGEYRGNGSSMLDCPVCHGTGKCGVCNGMGRIL